LLSLYLLRHGETEFSLQDRFCGAIDADLTDAGYRMAEAFADCYGPRPLRWSAIYTSTRRRTIATAAPFAAQVGVTPTADAGLDEASFGDWQGRAKSEIARDDPARFQRWQEDPTIGAPSGESIADVAERAVSVVRRIERAHRGGNVLLVGHKTILRVLTCALLGVELRRYRDWIAQPVCSLTVLDNGPLGHTLRLIDDLNHLPPWLRERALGRNQAARRATAASLDDEVCEARNGDDAGDSGTRDVPALSFTAAGA
jgi:probable phosphoglycerate mutase